MIFCLPAKKNFLERDKAMKENYEIAKEYKIKFYFKDDNTKYEINYEAISGKPFYNYKDFKLGQKKKTKKYCGENAGYLFLALISAVQSNNNENLTPENIKISQEKIKNNLVKIDLGEDFLIDIIPDIFELQNLCKNNLEVEVWKCLAPGTLKQMSNEEYLNKTDEILEKVKSIRGDNNSKMITFVEKGKFVNYGGMWGGTDNSWIRGYLYGQCGLYGYDNKYKTKYANYEKEIIKQKKDQAGKIQDTKEDKDLDNKNDQVEENENLDPEKLKTNGQMSLGGKITRIIFLIVLILAAIGLPTCLGIVGLLFSNVAIPIVVFSIEAILITLIVILILSIRNICRQNDLLTKQFNLSEPLNGENENQIDKNKNIEQGNVMNVKQWKDGQIEISESTKTNP